MAITRRQLLQVSACGLAGTGVAVLAGCSTASTSTVTEPDEFDTPLPIPPLAESRVVDGIRTFALRAQEGTWEFQSGQHVSTWGFNGHYGGPTLRANVGERVAVEVTNALPEATSTHWHGMHLPAEMDGGPHQTVESGDRWRAEWTIRQAPATLWYHPHPHGETERHVYHGLAGMFLLDDPDDPVSAALPHTYGVDDVPVVIADKSFDGGELVIDDGGNEVGLLGDVVTANGVAGAQLEVTTTLVRLRILNASTARVYSLGVPGRTMTMIASDGGLLSSPLEVERIRLSPAERAEVLVALEPGEDVMLHSFEPELGSVAAPFAVGANDSFDVLRLVAADELAGSGEVPQQLASFGIDPDAVSVRREFELEGREINGAEMDMARIDETVELEAIEMWTVINRNHFPHNFHIHDVQFEVRSIDGEPPPPELAGRKDTVYLEPQRHYELLLQFTDYTDAQMPYMYHCHLLRHEDEGMMGQFVVVAQGGHADESMIAGHDHH